MKKYLFLPILLLLSACASMFNNPTSVQYFDPGISTDGKSTIIFSAGAPAGCFTRLISLKLKDSATGKSVKKAPLFEATSYQNKSDFETHRGFLHAYSLKPGNYYFYPFDWGANVISANKASFSVEPDETVYLGELFFVAQCSTRYVVRDQFSRDMNRIKALNPAINTNSVNRRTMVLAEESSAP